MNIPNIGTLVLWDNRFGIVFEVRDTGVMCKGFNARPPVLNCFFVPKQHFENGVAKTDIETTGLYEFQEAIGENIYDPNGYAEGFRVLETARNMSGVCRGNDPIYWVKMYNAELQELKFLQVYRADFNGFLYWEQA